MMTVDFEKQANLLLNEFSDALDISDSKYEKAKQRYKSVGEWLERPDSKLANHEPRIYPQGSFRLGTVIKPITDEDKYDIDFVCQVAMNKFEISQFELKQLVGAELKSYAQANNMNSEPEEGKRCWTLDYADGIRFHMDILPSVPDDDQFKSLLVQAGIPKIWADSAIAITDFRNENYDVISNDWERSNPKGYALWFEEQMKQIAQARRQALVELRKYAKVEDVPAFQLKTPLQRSIQLLKRHRDIMFKDENEHKPISIIISTLASQAYNNEDNLYEALLNIVENMPRYIQYTKKGVEVINPVNPEENFAEKWQIEPIKEKMFLMWLVKAKTDLELAGRMYDINQFVTELKAPFGEQLLEKVAAIALATTTPSLHVQQKQMPPKVELDKPNKPWGFRGQ